MKKKQVPGDESAAYFQDRRDDEEEWEQQAERHTRRRPTSIVYSVRFSPKELVELRRVANNRRLPLSELIRTSVMQHVREADQPTLEVSALRVKIFSRTEARRVGTRGSAALKSNDFPVPGTVTVAA